MGQIKTIVSSTLSPLGLLSVSNYLLVEWFNPGHMGQISSFHRLVANYHPIVSTQLSIIEREFCALLNTGRSKQLSFKLRTELLQPK